MSLQLIAKQMEAKGRKGDSMLVHMTPGEVEGLQKLAESIGGTLTVNPETGLVEANFLKRMLPTLVGAGVGFATMNPYLGAAAGAAVGGAQAKQNNQDFLTGAALGGLSGFGAGSLGSGLAAAGSQAAQAGAMQTALTDQAAQQATQQAAQEALMAEGAKLTGAKAAQTTAQQLAAEKLAQEAAADMARREAGAAVINQAGETAAKDFAAQGIGDRAGQGISALMDQGSNVGREAFMSKVGGGAGLASDVGMAAASPMMAPGEAPGPAPVDDEMYSYTFDPGRTGAERTPTSSSAEREYFRSSYSPVRKVRASEYPVYAAQGGLMGLAEGGETAAPSQGMTGASAAAFDYLMGAAPSSSAGLPAMVAQAPAAQMAAPAGNQMYAFNPATGAFMRNPNYVDPLAKRNEPVGLMNMVGSGDTGMSGIPGDQMTDAQIAEFYEQNPTAGRFTRAIQDYNPFASLQERMDPGSTGRARDATFGGSLSGGSVNDKSVRAGLGEIGYSDAPADMTGMDSPSYSRAETPNSFESAYAMAEGGLLDLAKGGMASGGFVVPADVVSALGNGSTDAGLRIIKAMLGKVKPIKGKGDGLSDSIKTSIDGKQRARVADGEAYIDPQTVKRIGGAKKLYAMMDKIRAQAHGKTSQQRKVNPAKVLA